MTPKHLYTLDEISKIKNSGFTITLPESILNVISEISSQVGAPNYVKTPQFHSRVNKNRGGGNDLSAEDWAAIRNFKATERVEKTGIDKIIQELRGELNKLTEKNFDAISGNLIDKMAEIAEEYKDKIAEHIFEIASTNKFYSEVYAKLFKMVIDKFDFMRGVFEERFKTYMDVFSKIEAVDPNEDYDRFCDVNKVNERRKAISQFFVNLMLQGLLEKDQLMTIVHSLIDLMISYANESGKKAEGVEIAENIYILVKSMKSVFTEDEVKEMEKTFTIITAMKPSPQNSMTNKIMFKYMDLMDELAK